MLWIVQQVNIFMHSSLNVHLMNQFLHSWGWKHCFFIIPSSNHEFIIIVAVAVISTNTGVYYCINIFYVILRMHCAIHFSLTYLSIHIQFKWKRTKYVSTKKNSILMQIMETFKYILLFYLNDYSKHKSTILMFVHFQWI